MTNINTGSFLDTYYTGPERRHAYTPRRSAMMRRYRRRVESLVCECRTQQTRRKEDEGGYFEYCELMWR
ncbi:hypothetical protein MNBD_GAMMA10-1326 [hydrothermal vent metagenome]|uniref:Uncharacterized protein n=1 Tax=hydrothermal vent metagenome TaxID=652676 RepID=A0A3B0Y2T7_9ZZZZ